VSKLTIYFSYEGQFDRNRKYNIYNTNVVYDKCEKHINDQALGISLSIVDNGRLNWKQHRYDFLEEKRPSN